MPKVAREYENLIYLKGIMSAYEEIASIRMRRIKASVLQNRYYLEGLRHTYFHIKRSYDKELQKLRGKKNTAFQLRNTNNKTIAVFLSANTGLYGEVLRNTFEAFLEYIQKNNAESAIVGKIGRFYFESLNLPIRMQYFDLSDSPDDRNVEKIIGSLLEYEKIMIFHGRFKDILTQRPFITSVSGDEVYTLQKYDKGESFVKYIFEPSLQEVLAYFEEEILESILEHAFFESNLSKYASRMINLNQAGTKIDKQLDVIHLEFFKEKHLLQYRRQQSRLSSLKVANKI